MDRDAMLDAFDRQIRRHPAPDAMDGHIEAEDNVIRCVATGEGWIGVTWSDLDEVTAGPVIAAQVRRFAPLSRAWEWKLYSYDRPADLAARLVAAGFTPEPAEALMIAEIVDLALEVPPPAGVQLRPVVDEAGVAALVRSHDESFGGDHAELGRTLRRSLERQPSTVAAVVALAGDLPVAAGRVEFDAGGEFASLWGGGTRPAWRRRGVYRSMVAYRAALAAARGVRYLQVDASPDSRPILERLGFVQLAITTPFIHGGGDAAAVRQG